MVARIDTGHATNEQDADLEATAFDSLQSAIRFSQQSISEDHWCGELKSNVTITAEYIFLRQSLGHWRGSNSSREPLSRYLFSEQSDDGSWNIAPGEHGNISATVEAYLALKILGHTCKESLAMRKARDWIVTVGAGIENVRVFTRIYLATFGLFPWSAVPQLPAELIFMPSAAPINIYRLSSWARSTVIPLLVVCHHQPIWALPNGKSHNNDFLDELWLDPSNKNAPYHEGIWSMFSKSDWIGCAFTAIDMAISWAGGMRFYNPLRKLAIRQCMQWIDAHQEASGDWAGIFPPMHVGILAYLLEGYGEDDGRVRRALEAVERFAWQDENGKRIQACVSPVWDTVLMSMALADVPDSEQARFGVKSLREKALTWVMGKQLLQNRGDWKIYRPALAPGGFSFEYHNEWYPDVDDTAAAVIAFLKDDERSVISSHVLDAVNWILGMQCKDGGWAAFDVDNDKLFLNRIPFSDMDSLCDPSTPDIVGRVLEAFGMFQIAVTQIEQSSRRPLQTLLQRVGVACNRGISFLQGSQEINGAWGGRWGVNYIYGTSNVLCGLAFYLNPDDEPPMSSSLQETDHPQCLTVHCMARRGVDFLTSIQNSDGGWSESIATYRYPKVTAENSPHICKHFSSPSTASQTAWALMALSPYLSTSHQVITNGIRYLVQHQTETSLMSAKKSDAQALAGHQATPCQSSYGFNESRTHSAAETWPSNVFTGTGFPNHFYLGYTLYSHYFPMMALGRYLQAKQDEGLGKKWSF